MQDTRRDRPAPGRRVRRRAVLVGFCLLAAALAAAEPAPAQQGAGWPGGQSILPDFEQAPRDEDRKRYRPPGWPGRPRPPTPAAPGGPGILPDFEQDDRSESGSRIRGPGDRYHHYRRRIYVPWWTGQQRIVVERIPALAPPPPDDPDATPAPPEPGTGESAEGAPPDPGSPRTVVMARGARPRSAGIEPGKPLPGDRPVVLLDWRRYALPEPEPGTNYVRQGRTVALIDSTTRVVIALVGDDAQATASPAE